MSNSGKKLHLAAPELQVLRQQNDQICQELNLPVFQPMEQEWAAMTEQLQTLCQLISAQNNRETQKPIPVTSAQMEELISQVRHLNLLMEQAGKKKELRFSLPKFHPPRFSLPNLGWPDLLFISAMLPALWLIWPVLSGLRRTLQSLFR